jgi:hypothetical protein
MALPRHNWRYRPPSLFPAIDSAREDPRKIRCRAPTAIARTVVTKTKSGIFVLAAARVWSSSRLSNPAASRDCRSVQQSASTVHDRHAPAAIPHCRASSAPISHRRRPPSANRNGQRRLRPPKRRALTTRPPDPAAEVSGLGVAHDLTRVKRQSGSQETRRWREPDSNRWSLAERPVLGRVSKKSVEQQLDAKDEAWPTGRQRSQAVLPFTRARNLTSPQRPTVG